MLWLFLILIIPYIYVILRTYKGLVRLKPYHSSSDITDHISVIVPCRNEEEQLPHLLEGLVRQTYDHNNFEVIIVDDNSTDSSCAFASGFTGIRNIKVIKNSRTGKKTAIDEGIGLSTARIIVTTDADCIPGKDWLRTITSFFSEEKPDMLICPVIPEGGNGFTDKFQELEFLSLQAVTAGTAANSEPVMCNGANLAFTRETYLRNRDNLHPELISGDDVFLLQSVRKEESNKIAWLESVDSAVHTKTCKDITTFINQRVRWLSKAGAYNDREVIATAIVTFVTILLQTGLLIGGLFNKELMMIFVVFLMLKSIPDLLVIGNRAKRYGKTRLLWYFIPSQVVYPFYVLAVSLITLFSHRRFRIN